MIGIYRASIHHKRLRPKVHVFNYGGYYIRFDIDRIDELKNTVFSVDAFNLLSFYTKDHGFRNGSSLRHWCKQILKEAGIDSDELRIELQTFPRVLGYVFNPVSFYYCYEKSGELVAAIAEVSNTFGENHTYVVNRPKPSGNMLPKQFHVSPFYPVRGDYTFQFEHHGVSIIYTSEGKDELITSIKGTYHAWSVSNLLKCFFYYPFFTLWVIFSIHFQALRLLLKGAKFHSKPIQSEKTITHE